MGKQKQLRRQRLSPPFGVVAVEAITAVPGNVAVALEVARADDCLVDWSVASYWARNHFEMRY